MLFQKVMGWVYKSNKHPHVLTPPPPRQYSQAPQGQIGIEDQTLSTSHEEMCSGTMDSFSNTLVLNVISPPNTHETPPDHANYSVLFSTTYYPWPVCSVSISTLGMSQGGVWMRTPKSNSPHLTNAWRHPLKKTQRSCSRSGLYTWERGKGVWTQSALSFTPAAHPLSVFRIPGSHHASVTVRGDNPQLHSVSFSCSQPRRTWRGGGTLDGSRCSHHPATINPRPGQLDDPCSPGVHKHGLQVKVPTVYRKCPN